MKNHTVNVYAVKDIKAQIFLAPHHMKTHEVAIRSFSHAVQDEGTMFNKNPEDFTLYHLGSFNEETGELISVQPSSMSNASEHIKQ